MPRGMVLPPRDLLHEPPAALMQTANVYLGVSVSDHGALAGLINGPQMPPRPAAHLVLLGACSAGQYLSRWSSQTYPGAQGQGRARLPLFGSMLGLSSRFARLVKGRAAGADCSRPAGWRIVAVGA